MAQVTGAINAPFRAMRSAFTRRPEPSASEPPAPPPQLGCHVAEITSEEKDQFDGEEAQGLYRHAADIVQDVVLLGTPIGIEVSPLSLSPSPSRLTESTDPGLGEGTTSGGGAIDQRLLRAGLCPRPALSVREVGRQCRRPQSHRSRGRRECEPLLDHRQGPSPPSPLSLCLSPLTPSLSLQHTDYCVNMNQILLEVNLSAAPL
jgi:hypothetical protein